MLISSDTTQIIDFIGGGNSVFYLFLIALLILLDIFKKRFKLDKVNSIVLLLMIMVYGIRYNVGMDYFSYMYSYNSPTIIVDEIIYSLFENAFLSLGFDFVVFNFFLGIVLFAGLYFISKIYSIDFIRLVILFIITDQLFVSFNLMRQSLAGIFLVISLYYASEKRFVKFLIAVLIASGFHFSAIIFLPLYFISRRKINIVMAIILLFWGLILYKINIFEVNWIQNFIPLQYRHHIGGQFDVDASPGLGVFFYVVTALLLSIIVEKKNYHILPLTNLYIASYTLALFTLQSYILIRIPRYSFYGLPVILLTLVGNERLRFNKINIKKLIGLILIIAFILLFLLSIYNIEFGNDYRNLYYKTIFSR